MMNPFVASTIISTLTTTFKFISSAVAQEEISNLYASLKSYLGDRLGLERFLTRLEESPTSERQKILVEDLTDAVEKLPGTEKEAIINEILARTLALNKSLANLSPSDFNTVGMDLDNVKAANAVIGNVIAEGGAKAMGIRAKNSEFTENLEAGDIIAKK